MVHYITQSSRHVRTEAIEHSTYPLVTLSQPVYSLATNGVDEGRNTINLVTYCAPMSIKPRTIAIGLYKGTQSWINFLDRKTGVLQVDLALCICTCSRLLCKPTYRTDCCCDQHASVVPCLAIRIHALQVLRQEQAVLFEILGKTSAKHSNKFNMLQDLGWGVKSEFGHQVMEGCHGYLLLECMSGPVDAGDHDVMICKVIDYLTDAETNSDLLYTAHLRERGLL